MKQVVLADLSLTTAAFAPGAVVGQTPGATPPSLECRQGWSDAQARD